MAQAVPAAFGVPSGALGGRGRLHRALAATDDHAQAK
jgi:hypothetical protein